MPAVVPANGRFSLTVRLGGILLQGPPGPPGVGVPPGGTTGQTLTKLSDSDYDTGWRRRRRRRRRGHGAERQPCAAG